jgi:hypothetical protein
VRVAWWAWRGLLTLFAGRVLADCVLWAMPRSAQ